MNDKEKEHRLSSGPGASKPSTSATKATESDGKAKNMGQCHRCGQAKLVFNKDYYKETGFI